MYVWNTTKWQSQSYLHHHHQNHPAGQLPVIQPHHLIRDHINTAHLAPPRHMAAHALPHRQLLSRALPSSSSSDTSANISIRISWLSYSGFSLCRLESPPLQWHTHGHVGAAHVHVVLAHVYMVWHIWCWQACGHTVLTLTRLHWCPLQPSCHRDVQTSGSVCSCLACINLHH